MGKHCAVLYFNEVKVLYIALWCAVATGSFGFDVVDCFDKQIQCQSEYRSFECTECFSSDGETLCPEFGVQTYEVNYGARSR